MVYGERVAQTVRLDDNGASVDLLEVSRPGNVDDGLIAVGAVRARGVRRDEGVDASLPRDRPRWSISILPVLLSGLSSMTAKTPTLFLAVSVAPRSMSTSTDPSPQVRARTATLLRVGEAVTDPPVTLTVTALGLTASALAPITASMPASRAAVIPNPSGFDSPGRC